MFHRIAVRIVCCLFVLATVKTFAFPNRKPRDMKAWLRARQEHVLSLSLNQTNKCLKKFKPKRKKLKSKKKK